VQAREVSISLIGEAWVTTYSGTRKGMFESTRKPGGGMMGMGGPRRMGGGGLTIGSETSTMKQHERVYEFKLPLDSEKEYGEGREYRFEIKIPADILSLRSQMGGAGPSSPIKWYLSAKLDVPGGLDISKKVDVTIG
jgi:hypothetical protein